MECKSKTCKHDMKYHANKDRHILGTSHCTKDNCDCKELKE